MSKLIKRIVAASIVAVTLLSVWACSADQGEEVRSVRTVEVNEKGELVVIFTDGTKSVMGTVKGEDGKDGLDGKDGADGVDGENGKDGKDGEEGPEGAQGPQGIMGPEGTDGRSIASMELDENGNLLVTYDDHSTAVVDLHGKLYLLGGKCGDNVSWALYNGGMLVISGNGSTYDYAEGDAPWYALRSMLTAVYVDRSEGLAEGTNLLYGIDKSIITYSSATMTKWVDMTASAPIYSSADNTATPIGYLPLGSTLAVISEEGGYTKIEYELSEAFIETKYTVADNGSVVYDPVSLKLEVSRDTGANLRTFPDATTSSTGNTYANVPHGTILNCTGVSKNGNWYRVSYDNQVLYAYKTWVTVKG